MKSIQFGIDLSFIPYDHQIVAYTTFKYHFGSSYQYNLTNCYFLTHLAIHAVFMSCDRSVSLQSSIILTHWGRDKMDALLQTTLSNAFSWMNMIEFGFIFHWSLFLRVQLTIFHHWFTSWLGANQATSHYLNQWRLDYRHIYASLGLDDLKDSFVFYMYRTFIFIIRYQSRKVTCWKFNDLEYMY